MATSIEDACSIIPPKLLLPRDETCHCESYERDGYTLVRLDNGELVPLKHMEPLGAGTFGRVLRVECDPLCRYLGLPLDGLVMKKAALFHVQKDNELHKFALAGTLREGYLQDACSHLPGGKHPHIMPVYHVWRDGGNAPRATYLLTRKMARGSLKSLNDTMHKEHIRNATDNRPVWTPAALCDVLTQAGLALGHLHSRNVVHLDVKLDNLLVDEGPSLRLGDFGLATKCDALGCMHPSFDFAVGTLDYMAPEVLVRHSGRLFTADDVVDVGQQPLSFAQALKSPVTTKADVWSLGVVMHKLALQRFPFTAPCINEMTNDDYAACFAYVVCTQDPCIHESELAAIGPEVWALIKWMLTKDPSRRPTMEQVVLSPVLSQALQKHLPAVIAAGGWVPTRAATPAVPPGFQSLLPAPALTATESSAALAEAQALHLLRGAQAAAQLQAEHAHAAREHLAEEQAQARQQMAAMLGAAQAQARRIVAAAEEEAASIRPAPTPAPVPEPQPVAPATCLALLLLSARTAQPRLPQRPHLRPALVEGASSGPSEAATSTEPPATTTTTTTATPTDSTGSELTSVSTGSTGSAEGEDACSLDAPLSNDGPAKPAPAVCVVVVEAPAAAKPLQLATKPQARPQRKASPAQAPTTTTTTVATSPTTTTVTTTTSAAAPAECLVTEQRAGRRRGRRGGRKHRRSSDKQQQQQQDATAVSSPAARAAPAAPAAEARPEPAHPWWLRRRQQKKAKVQGRQ